MNYIHPPPVTAGDEVAVLALSSQVSKKAITVATNRLRNLYDLSPVVYSSVHSKTQESPKRRAEELHDAFASDQTAVFSVTGGDDQMRLLRYLDSNRLRSNPTRFFGISDNTHLHLALSAAGIVSYYGCQFVPGLSWDPELPEFTRQYLRRALFENRIGKIQSSSKWTQDHYSIDEATPREWHKNDGWRWDFPDEAEVTAPVWGGCCIVIEHMLAIDQFVMDPEALGEYVLAIESSGLVPDPYYVKSVLRCLGERRFLDSVKAIIVGRPKTKQEGPQIRRARPEYSERQSKAVREVCEEYAPGTPIVFNLDFGHTDPQIPIPIGGQVNLDPAQQSIAFVE